METKTIIYILFGIILILVGIIIYLLLSLKCVCSNNTLINADSMSNYIQCVMNGLKNKYSLIDIVSQEQNPNDAYMKDRNDILLTCLS